MSNLYESNNYNVTYRIVTNDLINVKMYTDRNLIEASKQISFDSQYEELSSVDYFIGSLATSMMLVILEQSRTHQIVLEDIEAVFHATLENPLSLIGVKGYEEPPIIKKIDVVFYLYADLEEEELFNLCRSFLNQSPIYNTLKQAVSIDVRFKLIL